MDNRFSGRGLGVAGLGRACRAGTEAVGRAVVGALEQLENRRLMSGTAVSVQWMGHTLEAIQNSYVVRVKAGVDFNAVAAKQKFTNVESLGGGGFYSFESTKPVAQIQKWGNNAGAIDAIQPNVVSHLADTTPSDPQFIGQWSLNNVGQPIPSFDSAGSTVQYGIPGDDIDATKAWDVTTGSKNVVVAVLDSGVDISHPDLTSNIYTNPGEISTPGANTNAVDDDRNGYIDDVHGWNAVDQNGDVTDQNGHGTHVAGIIGAQGNNGIGVSGINWNVSLLPVKVGNADGSVPSTAVIRGLQYITKMKQLWASTGGLQGADVSVANLSFGISFQFPYSTVSARAYRLAGEAGIITVVAAGNDTLNLDTSFSFPGKLSLTLPNVIVVAATDNRDQLTSFSNFGSQTVQIAAPGEMILSTWPSALPTDINFDGIPDTTQYARLSGTSQASPAVAGVLALMKAAAPTASADQLKRALFSSTDTIASLGGQLSQPGRVVTGGRVNAFKAVLAIQNLFQSSDTATRGNWQGLGSQKVYGREGAYVAGESTTFPAGVTVLGGNTTVFADSTRDATGLQKISDPSDRILAGVTSAGPLTIDLNFTDSGGNPVSKLVTIYVADANKAGRQMFAEVVDPVSGLSLSGVQPQLVSNFSGGQYLTYQVTGHTQLKLTSTNGTGAILNGVFVDPVPSAPLTVVGVNTTAGGNWQQAFGSEGAYVVGQSSRFPSFVVANISNASTVRAKVAKRDAATQLVADAPGKERRSTQYLSSTGDLVIDLNFTDGKAHQTSIYLADFGNKGRAERIEVLDPADGSVIARQDVTDFAAGKYVTLNLSGRKVLRITRLAGPDAVVGGIFFDAPQGRKVTFHGIDTTTRGTWKNVYGGSAAYLIDPAHVPSGTPTTLPLGAEDNGAVTITASGAMFQNITALSNNPGALQRIESSLSPRGTRVIARLAARTAFAVNLDFSDQQSRQVALYMLDSDTKNQRSQFVTVSDPTTGEVLAQQLVSNFSNGKYFVFDANGPVRVTVTRVTGPTAVLNGIFVN